MQSHVGIPDIKGIFRVGQGLAATKNCPRFLQNFFRVYRITYASDWGLMPDE